MFSQKCGAKLGQEEIYAIVRDVVNKNLSDVEMAAFVMAEHYLGMDENELLWLHARYSRNGNAN